MSKSPYQILGVSENATPDEIKKAYRKKAREYHPDLHPDDAQAAEKMNEVNEAYDRLINPDKYVERDRRSQASGQAARNPYQQGYGGYSQGGSSAGYRGGSQSGYGQGSQGTYANSGPYGWSGDFGFGWNDFFDFAGSSAGPVHPEAGAADNAEVQEAIRAINAGDYKKAASILNAVPSTGRNARWHYLIALANQGAGNRMLALDQIRKALEMDPDNADYKRAFNSMKNTGETYRQDAQARGFSVGFSNPAALCCGCLMLQAICYPGMYCVPCYV